jgi:hypothetical protein
MSDKAESLTGLFDRLRLRLRAIRTSREDLVEATRHIDERQDADTPPKSRTRGTETADNPEG